MTTSPLSPPRLRRVLVDSSAFLAVVNTRDEHHQAASAIWSYLAEQRFRLYITNFLIAETHNLFIARLGPHHARAFLQEITESNATIIRVRASDEQQARNIILRHTDKDYSLTDALSFVVMERLHISHAFTFDRHFAQYGLIVLTPGQS